MSTVKAGKEGEGVEAEDKKKGEQECEVAEEREEKNGKLRKMEIKSLRGREEKEIELDLT